MRTEQQIKRKANELENQKKTLEARLSGDAERDAFVASQIERLEDSILLLEWVLNEPNGKYHA
ncbi:hypothetical protein MO973_23235 [Paenibacillus sp. TRM 82003]|nr:hypothetical protein [Paenibacillus sp. TRM 82003]